MIFGTVGQPWPTLHGDEEKDATSFQKLSGSENSGRHEEAITHPFISVELIGAVICFKSSPDSWIVGLWIYGKIFIFVFFYCEEHLALVPSITVFIRSRVYKAKIIKANRKGQIIRSTVYKAKIIKAYHKGQMMLLLDFFVGTCASGCEGSGPVVSRSPALKHKATSVYHH